MAQPFKYANCFGDNEACRTVCWRCKLPTRKLLQEAQSRGRFPVMHGIFCVPKLRQCSKVRSKMPQYIMLFGCTYKYKRSPHLVAIPNAYRTIGSVTIPGKCGTAVFTGSRCQHWTPW